MGGDDVIVDDGGEAQGDVVLCHADLLGHLRGLDLDVDLDEALAERVDLDETGIDGLVEAAKLGDEADVALLYALVRVGKADAARDGTGGADTGADGVDCGEGGSASGHACGRRAGRTHAAVPALGVRVVADEGAIAALEVLLLGRLDSHLGLGLEAAPEGGGGIVVLAQGRGLGLGGGALAVEVGHDGCCGRRDGSRCCDDGGGTCLSPLAWKLVRASSRNETWRNGPCSMSAVNRMEKEACASGRRATR